MSDEKKKEMLAWFCLALGALFIVGGLVIWFLANKMNFQLNKVDATVIGKYEMVTDAGERHTMVDLSYRVGDQMMISSYDHPGVLDDDVVDMEVYYNVKEPGMLVSTSWSWESLFAVLMGIFILVPGLYLKGILEFNPDEDIKLSDEMNKKYADAKKRVLEGGLPMLAGILFVGFGIIMLVSRGEWWFWMFIIAGVIELLYIGMDFIPALITYIDITRINSIKTKVKATVYDVEADENLLNNTEEKKEKDEFADIEKEFVIKKSSLKKKKK